MARFDVIREKFSRAISQPPDITRLQVKDSATATTISQDGAKYLIDLYNWNGKSSQDIYEWLLINEPEIAAYVTKCSEFVSSAFNYFALIDSAEFDNIVDYIDDNGVLQSNIDANKKSLDKMKDTANDIARRNDIDMKCFQPWSAIMLYQGEVFLEKHSNLSLSIIPNNRVTILDDLKYLNSSTPQAHVITEENYLIIDEGLITQRILKQDQFVHIKLNDVPFNLKDANKRNTFGIYAVSPLQRCIPSIWLKGQILITETLWRWGNVPREHHSLNADAFTPEQYKGYVPKDKLIEFSQGQMNAAIERHADAISKKNPDQHYVTSSNITIKPVEHSSSDYMDSNNLLNQIENSVWDGLGIPVSVIRGKSDGSYASELVISSGVSLRMEQLARKIGKVVLENMKERLLTIDPTFPVRYLDIKISFELAESRLEKYKIIGLQKAAGIFTPTEMREEVEHPALTKDQINNEGIVTPDGIIVGYDNVFKSNPTQSSSPKSTSTNFGGVSGGRSDGNINYPTTSESANQQPTTQGDATKDTLDTENYTK